MTKPSGDGRPDNYEVENEMLKRPKRDGEPPKPATTPCKGEPPVPTGHD